MDEWMTVAQAADALGVAVRTAYAYIERGGLRAVRPRGRSRGWRVRRDELTRWMAEEWEPVGPVTATRGPAKTEEPAGRA